MQPNTGRPEDRDADLRSALDVNADVAPLLEGVVVPAIPGTAGASINRYDNVELALRLGFLLAIILTVVGLVLYGFSIATAVGLIVAAGLAGITLLRRLGH